MTDNSHIKINDAIARENPYGMLREPTFSDVSSFMRRNYSKDLPVPNWLPAASHSIWL